MKNFVALWHRFHWFDLLGLATILSVTGLMFLSYSPTDARRWIMLGIMGVMFVTEFLLFTEKKPTMIGAHLRLAFLTLLIFALIYIDSGGNGLIILFFVLSGEAMSFLPPRQGYGWIALWGVIVTVLLVLWVGFGNGLLFGLGTTCGFVFMGSAVNAFRQAEDASAESRRLLEELQSAHQQLQANAERVEQSAVIEERNRLAREMHDTLGHRLTVAAVQLEGAQKLIGRNPEKAEAMVATVRQQVLDGLQELRHTVATLREPLETGLNLRSALQRLTQNFQEATAVQTTLQLPDELPELSAEHRHALYRAAQEGLTNIQKHANAKAAKVNLQVLTNGAHPWLKLAIEDNGNGLHADHAATGFGLHGLRERAEQLGGRFEFQQHDQGGTRLTIELPININR